MESPVPATLVRQREAVAILLGGMLLGIQALVGKDPAVPVDRAQNGRLTARRPRAALAVRHPLPVPDPGDAGGVRTIRSFTDHHASLVPLP